MTAMTDWQPTDWWAAFDEHGLIAIEGTDQAVVRAQAETLGCTVRRHYTVRRLWQRTDSEWRPA